MATQLNTLTNTALDCAERAARMHRKDAHQGQAVFECDLCLALQSTIIACRTAFEATETVTLTPNMATRS